MSAITPSKLSLRARGSATADAPRVGTGAPPHCAHTTTGAGAPAAMPSSRLSLRLAQIPHDALAELAAQLCSESPALQAIAEECMAAHGPLPLDMVEHVLLSPDLAPSILGPLETEDGAAAAVCKQWLAGWNATNEPRRRLKQMPLDFPAEALCASTGGMDGPQMAAPPDGRLVVRVDTNPPGCASSTVACAYCTADQIW